MSSIARRVARHQTREARRAEVKSQRRADRDVRKWQFARAWWWREWLRAWAGIGKEVFRARVRMYRNGADVVCVNAYDSPSYCGALFDDHMKEVWR